MSSANSILASGSNPPSATTNKLATTADLQRWGSQWDHLVVRFSPELSDTALTEHLMDYGSDRWQLVAVDNGLFCFRRNRLA
jgi:hypothetical protein